MLTLTILKQCLGMIGTETVGEKLQLVGVAAMFIASKYKEMFAPEIGDFVHITDRAYTESQIRECSVRKSHTWQIGFCHSKFSTIPDLPNRIYGPHTNGAFSHLKKL